MFLATSKGFIFLVMDIVIITLICRAGWAAATYHQYVDDTIRQYSANIASQSNPAFADSQAEIAAKKQQTRQMEYIAATAAAQDNNSVRNEPTAPVESTQRYNDTSRQTNGQAFIYPDRQSNARQDENQRQDEKRQQQRPNSLALQSKLNDRPASQQQNGNNQQYGSPDDYDDQKLENRLRHYTSSNGKEIRSVEPLKDEVAPDMHQQMRVRVLPMAALLDRNSSEVRQRPPVPPKPHNPNRVSMQPSYAHERPDSRNSAAKVDRTSSMNAPEELRGQLPWSYFKARDDVPKKAFTELKEDEELPAVPVPDYTLHFPKVKRPNLSDSDGENSWSRYEQRY